ncbi:MAG: carbon monoxide dehydrogenase subunit G, partial [candidate division KSB1 bacterium]|nr:carbon monoxide dehydrogenase subunit G [candidate division KSB1 bacterium]
GIHSQSAEDVMKIQGEVVLPAAPEKLWDLLLDPQIIAEILPGCKDLKSIGPDQYEAIIEAKVGPISSRYQTRFALQDQKPYESYRLHIEGEGKGGFVRGDAAIRLVPENHQTRLIYEGEGNVGGMMARIGQRLVEAAAKMLIQRGFDALRKKIEERLQSNST